MSDNTHNKLVRENRNLKLQLKAVKKEVDTISGSRAYRVTRVLGHAKKELKKSPVKFTKKVIKRVVSRSSVDIMGAANNLIGADSLQLQYEQWIQFNEPDATELDRQRLLSDDFTKKPLISIITPVFNPPLEVFEDLIRTVLNQTYTNFELCLGNFGDNQGVKELIERYAKKDARIKDLPFSENKGIAENSNQILAKARGEYIALLDHDDTLSPDALYENVAMLNQDNYDFIYSDKDKIDEAGNRFEPFFKPGWSPEIMLNANYLTHLNIMRTSLVKKVGAWTSETDGAQDWDLFLKVVTASKKIGHIPKVLYHWRVIATSTAMSIEAKPYALLGQRVAVDKFLKINKIPAVSYHEGAELLLKWKLPITITLCVVRSASNAHLRTFLANLTKEDSAALRLVVFHAYKMDDDNAAVVGVAFIPYQRTNYVKELQAFLSKQTQINTLFFDDNLAFSLSTEKLQKLHGWLTIDGVVASAPKVVDTAGYTLDCGGVITIRGLRPLFVGSPPYHQAPIGNIEWVRDLMFLTPLAFMAKTQSMIDALYALSEKDISDDLVYTASHLQLTSLGRLVFDPKISIIAEASACVDACNYYENASGLLEVMPLTPDIYMNKNLSSENPMLLAVVAQDDTTEEIIEEAGSSYQQEAMVHAFTRNLSPQDLAENKAVIKKNHAKILVNPKKVLFILPDFQAIYAGLNNIFSFANFLNDEGLEITIGLMCDDDGMARQRALITAKYPNLGQNIKLHAVSQDNVDSLPPMDIAICTQWATAYLLAAFNRTQRKCYFIQDKESSFYPRGTISALVEYTYTFGFYALANTEGLLRWYQQEFGGSGILLKSVINLSAYSLPDQPKYELKAPYKVFFYARPNESRNAFEIALTGLLSLKKRLGRDLEIYAAGADWDAADYGIEKLIKNMGRIEYDKLPAFYRSMDAGIMFMFSGHPGVVASELMASGCPVVVNQYNDSTWNELYEHEKTCLVTPPTADAVADSIHRILTDQTVRESVIPAGRKKAVEFYGNYDASCTSALKALKKAI